MKTLVTGAGGFVGPHLIRELADQGHSVIATDIQPIELGGLPIESFSRCDFTDVTATEELMKDVRPEAIIHLAGWSHVGASWNEPSKVFQLNLLNTVNLFESAVRHVPGSRFLFVSSADVYGAVQADQLPLDEDSPIQTSSPYAVSKYSAELALRSLKTKSEVDLLILRPFNHIGPGQSPKFACPDFARQVVAIQDGEQQVLRHGNLKSKRDFLDVRDVCRAYRLVMEKGVDGDLYVIASGKSVSMEWIVERLFHLAGMEPKMELDPSRLRASDTPELLGSADKLKRTTGWSPEFDYDATLTDILSEARASRGQ